MTSNKIQPKSAKVAKRKSPPRSLKTLSVSKSSASVVRGGSKAEAGNENIRRAKK
jgi:hypothetical protein